MADNILDFATKAMPLAKFISVIAIIATCRKLLDFANEINHNSINNMQKLIAIKPVDDSTEEVLQEMLDRALFKKATGINKPKKIREWVLENNKSSDGSLTIKMFSQAQSYIVHDFSKISIKLTKSKRFLYHVSIWGGLAFLLIGGIELTIGVFVIKTQLKAAIALIIGAIYLFVLAVSMFNDASEFSAAKQIDKFLSTKEKEAQLPNQYPVSRPLLPDKKEGNSSYRRFRRIAKLVHPSITS